MRAQRWCSMRRCHWHGEWNDQGLLWANAQQDVQTISDCKDSRKEFSCLKSVLRTECVGEGVLTQQQNYTLLEHAAHGIYCLCSQAGICKLFIGAGDAAHAIQKWHAALSLQHSWLLPCGHSCCCCCCCTCLACHDHTVLITMSGHEITSAWHCMQQAASGNVLPWHAMLQPHH